MCPFGPTDSEPIPGTGRVNKEALRCSEKQKFKKRAGGSPLTALSIDMKTGLRRRNVNPLPSGIAGSNPALSTFYAAVSRTAFFIMDF